MKTWFALVCTWLGLAQIQLAAAPSLVAVSPVNGAVGVALTIPITFTFSEAMKPQQNVLWFDQGQPIDTSSFTYTWSADQRVLTCTPQDGWPPSRTLSWTLVGSFPGVLTGFENALGEGLPFSYDNVGSFTTSSGGGSLPGEVSTNSCGVVTTNYPKNTFAVGLQATYEQTGPGAPVPLSGDGFDAFLFTATVVMNGGGAADSISLTTPDETIIPLDAFRNNYVHFNSSNDLAGLQALYRSGDYYFKSEGPVKVPPSVLAVLPSSALPVIHISNYNEAQAIDETQPFTLRWDPLGITGASFLRVSIKTLSDDDVIQSPDPECPGALRGTSISWVIPENTLASNRTYQVQLELQVIGSQKEYAGDTVVFSSQRIITSFKIKTGRTVVPVDPFSITQIEPLADGKIRLLVSPTVPGKEYRLEQRNALDAPVWTATGLTVVAPGTTSEFIYTLPNGSDPSFFRIVSP